MRTNLAALILLCASFCAAQTHDVKPPEALKKLDFMIGSWVGKQDFNTQGGPAMVGEATNKIEEAIGGRYLEERLSTTLPGRKPTDTRHYISFDPKTNTYKAWWFNDTSVTPSEFEGTLEGTKLVMTSKPTASGAVLRVIYDGAGVDMLTLTLEMKQGEGWMRLFTSTYKMKA